MKDKIIIIGGGSLLNVCVEIIKLNKNHTHGYINDKKSTYQNIFKVKYLGNINTLTKNHFLKYKFVLAIGDNFRRMETYKYLLNKFKKINLINLIHPSVLIGQNVRIGKGNIICPNTNINLNTKIGNLCIFNSKNSIDHDNIIANFVSTGPGVTTGGHVIIKESVFLGINASVKNNIILDKNSILAGGSFLRKNTKKNSIYTGVPSKFLKKRKPGDKYL
jgi:sugar O-acyltransferase (sialic acid O-acetyltransferase NeuD family)